MLRQVIDETRVYTSMLGWKKIRSETKSDPEDIGMIFEQPQHVAEIDLGSVQICYGMERGSVATTVRTPYSKTTKTIV